jgi:predicted ferric reductase
MQPSGNRPVIISFRIEHLLGWGVTIILCLIPVFLYFDAHPLSQTQGFAPTLLMLGRITGLVGMVMYALNLIYATRLRFLEYWFGGLNRVYIAHHLLGGFALILLAFHPMLLALRYVKTSITQAALLLIPNGLTPIDALWDKSSDFHTTVIIQWGIFFGIIAFWGMVVLLLITFFIKIPYHVWLFTHRFLGYAFFLAGLHVIILSSNASSSNALRLYVLVMSVLGILAFIYRSLVGKILIRKYKYSVVDVAIEAGNVTHITMAASDLPMSYKPGQFVFIRFPELGPRGLNKEWHPFSISSSPKDKFLRLSIKGLGDYTNKLLTEIQPGTVAEVEGAYGKFTYTNYKNKNQVWVAGGIGITPFLSMVKSLPDTDYKIDLYYCVRSESELLDWDKLSEVAALKQGDFKVHPYVAEKQQGNLTADIIEQTSGNLKGKDIFICGPPPMMSALRKQLKAKLIPGTSIHTEEFGMS